MKETVMLADIGSDVYRLFWSGGDYHQGYGRDIQIWDTTINWGGNFKLVINFPVIVLSY